MATMGTATGCAFRSNINLSENSIQEKLSPVYPDKWAD
jgi:hypothetical protein